MTTTKIDIDEMKRLFHYDKDTGAITRATSRGSHFKEGATAGTKNKRGYIVIHVSGKLYGAHRLAWAMHTGKSPNGHIDHINGVRDDNRIANLRDVSKNVNMQNQRKPAISNKVGLLGVSPKRNKFIAVIFTGRKQKYLGTFTDKYEAHAAYLNAKRLMHEGCSI